MARYGLEVTPELSIEIDVSPGVPVPRDFDLGWEANTEDELRELVRVLGFDLGEMDPTKRLFVHYGLPVTRDGECVAKSDVHLWIGDELDEREKRPPLPALARLRAEALAERSEAAEPSSFQRGLVTLAQEGVSRVSAGE